MLKPRGEFNGELLAKLCRVLLALATTPASPARTPAAPSDKGLAGGWSLDSGSLGVRGGCVCARGGVGLCSDFWGLGLSPVICSSMFSMRFTWFSSG